METKSYVHKPIFYTETEDLSLYTKSNGKK